MKKKIAEIRKELDAIREAGTWREERIITTPQRFDGGASPGMGLDALGDCRGKGELRQMGIRAFVRAIHLWNAGNP